MDTNLNAPDPVQVRRTVDFLNQMLEIDPELVTVTVDLRLRVREEGGSAEAMREHPTAQVTYDGEETRIGLLGWINGLLGVRDDGKGPVAAIQDIGEDGTPTGTILRFLETSKALQDGCIPDPQAHPKDRTCPDCGGHLSMSDRGGLDNWCGKCEKQQIPYVVDESLSNITFEEPEIERRGE